MEVYDILEAYMQNRPSIASSRTQIYSHKNNKCNIKKAIMRDGFSDDDENQKFEGMRSPERGTVGR